MFHQLHLDCRRCVAITDCRLAEWSVYGLNRTRDAGRISVFTDSNKQEKLSMYPDCVQLRNRNAISHVLKLFGRFLVRRADVFSHLFRTSIPSFSESNVLRDSHSRAG